MKTTLKTTFLALTLFFAATTGLKAQDKYDYAVVSYSPSTKVVEIAIGANDFKSIEIGSDRIKGGGDATAGIAEVNKLTDQGWEVINTAFGTDAYATRRVFVFYLRKKK